MTVGCDGGPSHNFTPWCQSNLVASYWLNLVMLAQTYQHGLVQTLPNAIGIPVMQAPPARHTTAVTQGLRQVFPWDACLQHEQNSIERCFIAPGEPTCATFDGRSEGRDQGLQLSPQFLANGLSCHEGQMHKCFWLISKGGAVSGSKAHISRQSIPAAA